VKNKLAPPFRQAEFDVLFNVGISKIGEILDWGVEKKIVEKSGSWYSYKNEKLGQGRDQAMTSLQENPETARAIERAIYDAIGFHKPPSEGAAAPPEAVEKKK